MIKKYSFEKSYADLPNIIALFPLTSALLLPRSKLPLNLFENRYLHMFDHALSSSRLIGMIQPTNKDKDIKTDSPKIYKIGCAGIINAFSQTNDNRYEIVLKGLCRFRVLKEVNQINGFRQAEVSWDKYSEDLKVSKLRNNEQRSMFENKLKLYLEKIGVNADWQAIEASTDEDLINSISMGCPFNFLEKQVLLEAKTLNDRLKVLNSLIEMGLNENESSVSRSIT
ncbi:LON peptidase substrate-binding domain-containing protein [Alphaproteobacteria bacterium]|nr:LON peptidase substrate-binding domain-containing protein [Alphaproteobacteria bacterium]